MEPYKKKKLWIVLAAAALVVILLVVLALTQSKREPDENRIQLPSETASDSSQTESEASRFAEITVDNVQTIIEGLSRPDSYHQTLEITVEYNSAVRKQTVEVWKCETAYHIISEEPSGTRNILTDGSTLYLWYNGDSAASEITLDSSISSDDLIGVPTYEEILSLPKDRIEEANFVVVPELDNASCVFISTKDGDTSEYYWVSLSTGLLCKQTSLYQSAPLRTTLQTEMEWIDNSDASVSSRFALPDGTEPFPIQK